jgi:crossover junction endodeoxyribonuclease RuvC
MRLIGLDPGLRLTGWGVIEVDGNRLRHVAHGVVVLAPARAGLPVFEYAANLVKKSVTGAGHADKRQIAMMVGRLLPGVEATSDAADALAVAICHAHHRATAKRVEAAL